jgi:hypothetical protein
MFNDTDMYTFKLWTHNYAETARRSYKQTKLRDLSPLSNYTDRVVERICGLVFRVPGYRFRGPDFLRSSGSGTRSTQPRDYNWGATWKESSGSGLEIREYGRRDSSRWPSGSFYPQKLALTSPTSGGRSVGIVRFRTQATEFSSV